MSTNPAGAQVAEYDFLPDLLGEQGNVYNVFAHIAVACQDHGVDYQQFRAELDAAPGNSYDDVLAKVESWFGPQDAIEQYRAHRAELEAERLART